MEGWAGVLELVRVDRWMLMSNQRLSISCLVAAILSVCFCVDSVFATQPSFDCSKASRPDEVAICSNETLTIVDNVANNGFEYLRLKLGRAAANKIDLPLIKKRQGCGGNYQCILNAQIEAINTFISYGAPIAMPNLSGDSGQQNNGAREELAAPHKAAPQAAQEVERRRQDEGEVARQLAPQAENRGQEELEAARRSTEQVELQRQAEADSVQHALKEARENFEKELSHNNDIQIALLIVIGLLVLGGALILAKVMVRGKQRTLGPSLIGDLADDNTQYEPSTSTHCAAPSAQPPQSSVNGHPEAFEEQQAPPPFNESQASPTLWYYEKAGNIVGPVTDDVIKALVTNNEIDKDTLVWKSAFGSQWVPIHETELIS
jgi:uncharacterized protein